MDLKEIDQAILSAKNHHSQLILLVGKYASKLSKETVASHNFPIINLGLELSEQLINTLKHERPKLVTSIFTSLIEKQQAPVIILDHIEILFDRSLSIDPLKLLQNSARNITLVVTWPGEKTATTLSYATSNHPEHRGYKISKLGDTLVVEANINQ